ncbi:ParB/RepB/Spo0J family partition protein [Candidatus Saccharibacteria bacterium]|nr:ParB/RepB/Spo0J family partition protein [Candidatus Saccharibacteria bacterium]
MTMKKGLGRGFESLIPTDLIDESLDPTASQDEQLSDFREILLEDIKVNPKQPRQTFDEQALEELAQSIRDHGVIQPIVLTPVGDGKYEIVAGERRFRGASRAGLDRVPALVRTLDDQHKLEISLIENLQRRDLNVLETATAYLKLRDQFNLSLEEIGQRVGGKSVSAVSNTLRLLRLPEIVKKAIQDGQLTEGQARPLINADPEDIASVLPRILQEEWSARKIEQYVVDLKKAKKVDSPGDDVAGPDHHETLERLSMRFSSPVQIRTNTRGAGKIVIPFKNDTEFDRITKLLSE